MKSRMKALNYQLSAIVDFIVNIVIVDAAMHLYEFVMIFGETP